MPCRDEGQYLPIWDCGLGIADAKRTGPVIPAKAGIQAF